ncbi:MAG: CHAT domain-containing protein, partial [Planctomycetes bacterium]|nr:CHAT domain-containing protein [Planctomycetota bacterium]
MPVAVWRHGKTLEVALQPGPLGVHIAPHPARKAWDLGFGLTPEEEARQRAVARVRERGGDLERLPGTDTEVRSIYRTFTGRELDPAHPDPRVEVYLRENATEPTLRAAAGRAQILHLASHHLVGDREAGIPAGIALTMPARPTEDDDGFLRLRDLFGPWFGVLNR